jgi:hypothetical protein
MSIFFSKYKEFSLSDPRWKELKAKIVFVEDRKAFISFVKEHRKPKFREFKPKFNPNPLHQTL